MSEVHPESGLSKATWTDADFGVMGWHDCGVHAISLAEPDYDNDEYTGRLLLDLDYIVRWVHPRSAKDPFTFWVAPATLVFHEAWDITASLGPVNDRLEIDVLHRLDPPDAVADPAWHVEGRNFDLRLRAAGFTQYVRAQPQLVSGQGLGVTQRGGITFAEHAFSSP